MEWDTDFSASNLPSDGDKCLFWAATWEHSWGTKLGWFEAGRIFIEDYGYLEPDEFNDQYMDEETDLEPEDLMPTHWCLIIEPE